ncbi:DUF378 domain-containing protein [Sporosarcina jiandibaonis]|uniref:DUF378 domain-containing protein n=1 Tax=Sporosarcina jiandibaonis TaxID=2715535 RepID=UPI001555407A|nr:DUF378 domain-containing protein [Sporosarcina jiandibaonis]
MGIIRRIALALVIIGAINWGLIGFFNFDLVAAIFGGQDAALSRLIYALVGLSGLVCIGLLLKPDEETATDRRRFTNPNLNTEFGEEPDFTKEKNPENKSDPNNHQGPLM